MSEYHTGIQKPSLQLFAEQVYPSKNQLLLAIDYNNVVGVKVETVKLGKDFHEILQKRNQDEIASYLKNAKKSILSINLSNQVNSIEASVWNSVIQNYRLVSTPSWQ